MHTLNFDFEVGMALGFLCGVLLAALMALAQVRNPRQKQLWEVILSDGQKIMVRAYGARDAEMRVREKFSLDQMHVPLGVTNFRLVRL